METLESSAAVALGIGDVLRNIFKNLSVQHLCKVAVVCKIWNEISAEELEVRHGILHFLQELPEPNRFAKDPFQNASRFQEELKAQFYGIEIKPAYCIAFANSSFIDYFQRLYPRYSAPVKKTKISKGICYDDYKEKQEYINSVALATFETCLPASCKIGMYIGSNIISNKKKCALNLSKKKQPVQVIRKPVKLVRKPAISGYVFSELPGNQLDLLECKENGVELADFMKSNDENIESVLVLLEHKYISFLSMALEELTAFHKSLIYPVRIGSSVVPIFKGNNVKLIYISVSKEDLVKMLKDDMKNENFNSRNTVVFLIADDIPSSSSVYRVCDSLIVRYPDIPVIGLIDRPHLESNYPEEIKPLENIVKQNIPKLDNRYKLLLISFKDL